MTAGEQVVSRPAVAAPAVTGSANPTGAPDSDLGLHTGTVLYTNGAFAELLGYRTDSLIGASAANFLATKDR